MRYHHAISNGRLDGDGFHEKKGKMSQKLPSNNLLPLKRQTKIGADDILIFYLYLLKKIRLDFSREHRVLFSLKNNEKMFMLSASVVIGALRVNLDGQG